MFVAIFTLFAIIDIKTRWKVPAVGTYSSSLASVEMFSVQKKNRVQLFWLEDELKSVHSQAPPGQATFRNGPNPAAVK